MFSDLPLKEGSKQRRAVCKEYGYRFGSGWVSLDLKVYVHTTLKQHPTCLSRDSVSQPTHPSHSLFQSLPYFPTQLLLLLSPLLSSYFSLKHCKPGLSWLQVFESGFCISLSATDKITCAKWASGFSPLLPSQQFSRWLFWPFYNWRETHKNTILHMQSKIAFL